MSIDPENAAIGACVAAYRGGMSQRELARRMELAGYRWTHLTVASVERGQRPLRVAEARGLSNILGVTLNDLAGIDGERASAEMANERRLLRTKVAAIQSVLDDEDGKRLIFNDNGTYRRKETS